MDNRQFVLDEREKCVGESVVTKNHESDGSNPAVNNNNVKVKVLKFPIALKQ